MTVGQKTYSLPEPFFTIATQNPIEQEGTYPLPEAQLDRFMFNIKVDYPSAEEEERILASTTRGEQVEVRKVLSGKAILNLQGLVGKVAVSEYIVQYVARLVRRHAAERPDRAEVRAGIGRLGRRPAPGSSSFRAARRWRPWTAGFPWPSKTCRRSPSPCLRHRISTNFQAQAEGMSNEDLIERLVRETPPPVIPKYEK